MDDYTAYGVLEDLPTLVRKQRALEAKIVPLASYLNDEQQLRKEIDARLVAAGIPANDGVTCLGYDVVHHERQGNAKLNPDALTAELVVAGLDRADVALMITACTERDEPSSWASVKPSKSAKVRKP